MKNKIIEKVSIFDVADKGRGVGRHEGKTIFVEHAIPGDVADVEIYKKSKSFDEARVLKLTSPSPHRTEPQCSHFGLCGGCKWQNMDYSSQLQFKEKTVRDAMERLAKIESPPILPIAGSENIYHYRNKLEFTFTNLRYLLKEEMDQETPKQLNGLGFHIPGKFNKVLDIDRCYLQDQRSDQIRKFVAAFTLQHNLPYFDLKRQTGMMRNLIIRNTTLGEWMVIVVFAYDDETLRNALMESIANQFPWINSLQYIINTKRNDSLHDQTPVVFKGQPFITERLESLKFKVGPKSFFQTNTLQALRLYNITREFAGLTGTENVYDLYTGTGSIAAFISAGAKKVTGVEYVKEAIDDARENAELNHIENMQFFAGDMKDVLSHDFFITHGKPDVIITDPPRAGMHADVVNRIMESGATRVVYVSCNPATQARDIAMMAEKYEVIKMQPVDMFPHTAHVENVALLQLKN